MLVLTVSMFSGVHAVSVAMEHAYVANSVAQKPAKWKETTIGHIEFCPKRVQSKFGMDDIQHMSALMAEAVPTYCEQNICESVQPLYGSVTDDQRRTCRSRCSQHLMTQHDWSEAYQNRKNSSLWGKIGVQPNPAEFPTNQESARPDCRDTSADDVLKVFQANFNKEEFMLHFSTSTVPEHAFPIESDQGIDAFCKQNICKSVTAEGCNGLCQGKLPWCQRHHEWLCFERCSVYVNMQRSMAPYLPMWWVPYYEFLNKDRFWWKEEWGRFSEKYGPLPVDSFRKELQNEAEKGEWFSMKHFHLPSVYEAIEDYLGHTLWTGPRSENYRCEQVVSALQLKEQAVLGDKQAREKATEGFPDDTFKMFEESEINVEVQALFTQCDANTLLTEQECRSLHGKELDGWTTSEYGWTTSGFFGTLSTDEGPKGCYLSDGRLYFNEHGTGSANIYRPPICKKLSQGSVTKS